MPDGALPGQYGGGNSPVRQNCVVEPSDVGRAAIWSADGYLCPDGMGTGIYTLMYASDVPPTGFTYGYDSLCGSWVPVLNRWQADCLYAPITTVPFLEAPLDGNNYVRNGLTHTWVQEGAGTGYVIEAPTDGGYYVRQNGQWVRVESDPDLVTTPINCGTY
jgi:hypothetical protein